MHERNKATLLISKQTTHVSANEYRLDGRFCPGIQSVPTLIITDLQVVDDLNDLDYLDDLGDLGDLDDLRLFR